MFSICSDLQFKGKLAYDSYMNVPLPGRSLLIVSSELKEYYSTIANLILSTTDLIFLEENNVVNSMVNGLKNYKWDNIAVMLHGKYYESDQSIVLMNNRMTTDPLLIESDQGVQKIVALISLLKSHITNGTLHVFSCMIGESNGLKYLLSKIDEEANFPGGISVANTVIGNGATDVNWQLGWNTKTSYLKENTYHVSPIRLYLKDTEGLNFTLGFFDDLYNKILLMTRSSIYNSFLFKNSTPTTKYICDVNYFEHGFSDAIDRKLTISPKTNRGKYLYDVCPVLIRFVYDICKLQTNNPTKVDITKPKDTLNTALKRHLDNFECQIGRAHV